MPDISSTDKTVYRILNKSTVKILSADLRRHLGTGFFIAEDLILTCQHVVKNTTGKVFLCYPNIERDKSLEFEGSVSQATNESIDLALIETVFPDSISRPTILPLEEIELIPGAELYGYGYPKVQLEGDAFTLEFEGYNPYEGQEYIKAKLCNIKPGHSGSPILDKASSKICGLISLKLEGNRGGLIIPVSRIFKTFPLLKDKNIEATSRHRIWLNGETSGQLPSSKYSEKTGSENRRKVIFTNRFSDCASFTIFLSEPQKENDSTSYNLSLQFSFDEERIEVPTGCVGLRLTGGRLKLKIANGELLPSDLDGKTFIESTHINNIEDGTEVSWTFKKGDEGSYMEGRSVIFLGKVILKDTTSLETAFHRVWVKHLYFDNYEFIEKLLVDGILSEEFISGEKLSDQVKLSNNQRLAMIEATYRTLINPQLDPYLSQATESISLENPK